MDVQRWNALQEAFNRLAEMRFDEQSCALRELEKHDFDLANEVRELLEEDTQVQHLPEMNVERLLQEALHMDEPSWPVQSQVGPYRLIKFLGEGGMGVVYMAERPDIAGPVAIKLLRDAWLSPARRQRFAIEQQTLGLLNHPSIARIYDAGTTEDGTPWFVMEFVRGVIISDYLRSRNANAREIMTLFGAVCETVRHAHSLAIIHRDLKPSNILITDDGKVKLLDFGIAKQMDLVDRGIGAPTVGLRLFTPAYAAPEMQSENRVGIFTDIYSMGAILYELVTGSTPFPDGTSNERNLQKPSRAMLTMKGCDSASIDHGSRPTLTGSEWADIDAICMKALDKEPENRYRSMDALIEDTHAFLDERPLDARKYAFFDITRKFLYRNRFSVLSIGLGLTAVIVACVLFTIRLSKARDEAIAEARRSARLQQFTESIFTGGEIYGYPPPGIKVTHMLDRGRSEALQITADPQLQAAMFQSLGTAYNSLGHYADAEPLLQKAKLVVCASGDSLQCADIEDSLGEAMAEHDSSAEAVALTADALRIKQKRLPPNDPSLANAFGELGFASAINGEIAQATQLYARELSIAMAYGRPTRELAAALDNNALFGFAYNDPRALEYGERSAQMNRQLFGSNSFESARSELYIGQILMNYGRYAEAEHHSRLAVMNIEAWSGPREGTTARYRLRLAEVLQQEGKLGEAKRLCLQALAITTSSETPSSLEEGDAYFDLGFIELQQNNLNAAENNFRQAISLANQDVSVNLSNVDLSKLGLATICDKRGDPRRAEGILRRVLAATKFPKSYVGVAGHALLGHVLLEQNRPAEAEGELRQAYAWLSHDSTIRPHTVMAYEDLAKTEKRLGKEEESRRIMAELHARSK